MSANSTNQISRRSFVSTIAATGVAAGATMIAQPAQAQPAVADNTTWDKECDVLVIGYGGAGAVSAIAAHDAGADVLVLEKQGIGGGNTMMSGGGVLCPTDKDQAYTYMTKLFDISHSEMDESLVRVFADRSVENVDFVCSLKPDTQMAVYGGASYKSVEGADSQQKYGVVADTEDKTTGTGHTGADLFAVYDYAVSERGIQVMLSTPAKRLLTNAAGEVVGAVATTQDGADINVKARKAVILTTGGYEYDEKMLQNHVKGYPIYALGSTGNTGDGVRMAMGVGAEIWHMNGVSCALGFHCDDYPNGFLNGVLQPSTIWVNKQGKRYVMKADTIAELAEKIGVDPDTLVATVEKWNEDVAAGEDTLFGRPVEHVENTQYKNEESDNASSAPLDTPPFYAIPTYPTMFNTQGGPHRNDAAQVLDVFGDPIPRLYSAGELGSFWGLIYQGAGNNAESVVFGRIAGENAAKLESWDK